MIRILTLATALALTHLSIAQTSVPKREPARGQAAADINEDIEVMRRLLVGALTGGSSPVAQYGTRYHAGGDLRAWAFYDVAAANPLSGSARDANFTAEGVYLDGKGVVFSITMSKPARDPMPTDGVTVATSLNDWERTLKQIRGEKQEASSGATGKPPSTSDIILKVLHDNGARLRISDRDEIVVAVTFRGENQTNALAGFRRSDLTNPNQFSVSAASDFTTTLDAYAAQAGQPATQPDPATASHGKSARDFEILGDLHLRQKQYQEAAEAYANALKSLKSVDLYRKSAEVHMQLGRFDEAKKYVDLAHEYARHVAVNDREAGDAKKANPGAAQTSAKPQQLPGKLIITVPMRTLEEAGQGKVPFDAFKKSAKVDYFPAGERKAKD